MENRTNFIFRILFHSELEDGYKILCDASEWLNSKGIKQWIRPLPKEIYKKWHDKNQNFGLFFKDELAVVLSLVQEKADKWEEFIPEKNPRCLNAIATAMKFKGRQLGKLAIKEARRCLRCDLETKNGKNWILENNNSKNKI